MALFALYAVTAIAVIAAGFGYEFLMLWVVPWFVGNLLMLTAFGWAPHHDHSETGRYRDTRISLFPGADLLCLYQNLHLVHHMLPSIPFYRYRVAFSELRPLLEQKRRAHRRLLADLAVAPPPRDRADAVLHRRVLNFSSICPRSGRSAARTRRCRRAGCG